MKRSLVVFSILGMLAIASVGTSQGPNGADRMTADFFKSIEIRSLGPSLTTGRVADVAVDTKNPDVYYIATAAGGLWKSENRGITFTPVFDDSGSFNLCCIIIDPKNSNILWLGTGENSNPRAAMYGDGVYKSTDAGKTWTRVGLVTSEHIGNIKIDPRNSDVVYVAAQGPLWSAGGDRGVYKTADGGKTWKAVLTVSPDTGANEVVIDPNNPDVLYASTWQRRRGVGQFIGGGPESAIYKSTNAGNTWTKLTNGLPKGDMGRIALGVDPKAKPTRVYALCNAKREESGFYRSDDAGATWTRIGHMAAGGRGGGMGGGRGGQADDFYRGGDPGYYHELFVDPVRPDTIWSTNTNLDRSEDGGKTWAQVPIDYNESHYGSVHVDFHAVWSDPTDRNHYIVGNDGGAYETYDNGLHFRHFDNLPVTQFYRVAVDNAKPFYKVCGGAQDNNSMCGPSRTVNNIGIRTSDWIIVGGGDGFQSRVDPEDPNIVYATSQSGGITRLDLRTGVSKSIRPRVIPMSPGEAEPGLEPEQQQNPPVQTVPAGQAGQGAPGAQGGQAGRGGRGGGAGERTNWDCPYIISPHSPTRLYWGSTRLYRTDDRGDHWTVVSPDLTRNLDPTTIPIMGKVWPTDSVSYNQATTPLSTIVSIDESPLMEGLLYVGTDDGLLQVSEDGGKNWRKVDTFPGIPAGTYVSDIFASPRDGNIVFVALNNWQKGDFKPYLLRSDDRGRTFTSVAGDLPDRHNIWTVVQDHVNGNLLFAGTEFGLYFTVDGGNHWVQLKGGLPVCQVRDLAVQKRESDLALGTFGRGFYVLDDYSPLREITAQSLSQEAELYPLRHAYEYTESDYEHAAWGNEVTPNPRIGAVFTYSIGQELPSDTKLVITITDDTGKQVRRMDQLPVEIRQPGENRPPEELPKTIGIHRVLWNLRSDPVTPAAATGAAGAPAGRGGGGSGAAGGAAGAGAAGGAQAGRGGGAAGAPPAGAAFGGFGGRGGGAPLVEPGHYIATLGKMTGDTVTPIGKQQSFMVLPLPAKNY
jgi:photosystem II stability/assembly factor-like uncharacterized protein